MFTVIYTCVVVGLDTDDICLCGTKFRSITCKQFHKMYGLFFHETCINTGRQNNERNFASPDLFFYPKSMHMTLE